MAAHLNAMSAEGAEEALENAIGLVHFVVKEIEWIRLLSGRLCNRDLGPERLRRDLESIRKLSGSVTQQMRGFLREARRMAEGGEIVEIGALVEQAVLQVSRREAQAEISACIAEDARGLGVAGDLLVAVVAVLENAVDFSCDGGEVLVHVQVEVERNELKILIEDSGIGMNSDVLSRCQARGFTTRRDAAGHGFGLHAASRIIARNGGVLFLESSVGVGTRALLAAPCGPHRGKHAAPVGPAAVRPSEGGAVPSVRVP